MKALIEFMHYITDYVELQEKKNDSYEKRFNALLKIIKAQNEQIVALTHKVEGTHSSHVSKKISAGKTKPASD